MKFSATLLAAMLTSSTVHGLLDLGVTSNLCGKQEGGVVFNMTKVEGTECSDGCSYKICMEVKKNKSLLDILKDPFNKLTHTCVKPDSVCQDGSHPGFLTLDVDAEVLGIDLTADLDVGSFSQCQIVKGGNIAEFLLGYDEGECGRSVLDVVVDAVDYVASCGTLDVATCVGLDGVGLGTECVWRLQAPECEEEKKEGGGGGDPHFSRWGQDRDTFHGECDLVLIHSEGFHEGAGLDLHARTTIHSFYSYIETAALRVGNHVMEFYRDHLYLNGVRLAAKDLPVSFLGGKYKYEIKNTHTTKDRQNYQVDLGDDSTIFFNFYKGFLTFKISGHKDDLKDSVGLLGDYETGDMVTRYGDVVNDFQEHAFEWQVQPDDGMLFREARSPQFPFELCRLPTAPRPGRRQLRGNNSKLFAEAEEACAHIEGGSFHLCVDDVMMTEDIGLASTYL